MPVPYAHKIAIQEIQHGSHIIKYGQSLGVATEKIGVGEVTDSEDIEIRVMG